MIEVKQNLYTLGVDVAKSFLRHNKLPLPIFFTYEEAQRRRAHHSPAGA
jgi:hypothetical protein